jgi:hypothetical protein
MGCAERSSETQKRIPASEPPATGAYMTAAQSPRETTLDSPPLLIVFLTKSCHVPGIVP